MLIQILILVAGLALVLLGAEALVEGASDLARRFGVSEFVIGLTIVAMGTSAPEMVVSFISSIEGKSDMALGNIVGSNIFNTAFILGLSALICPIVITESNLKRDIPLNFLSSVLLMVLALNQNIFGLGRGDRLSRIDGIVFLSIFIWYMVTSFMNGRSSSVPEKAEEDGKEKKLWISILYVAAGLAGLIFGGKIFVGAAEEIARMAGMSDKLIAITVLAAGTSLPELATSVVAAAKGKAQLALGNILGSNTFNILFILGGAALINPLDASNITYVDFGAIILCSLIIWISAWTLKKKKLDRLEGALLVLVEIAYMTYLILN